MRPSYALIFLLCAALMPATITRAQDADGDGLPDAIERTLGADPQVADQFELVIDDKSRADGDKGFTADNYFPERDIAQVFVAAVGGNRFIWRVSFAADYVKDNSNLILYLSLWNAYNRKNVATYYWNEIENKPDFTYQFRMLPVLGVEYEF